MLEWTNVEAGMEKETMEKKDCNKHVQQQMFKHVQAVLLKPSWRP